MVREMSIKELSFKKIVEKKLLEILEFNHYKRRKYYKKWNSNFNSYIIWKRKSKLLINTFYFYLFI